MRSALSQRGCHCLTVVLLVLAGASTSAQSDVPLASLTVPESRLPTGCRLRPPHPSPTSELPDGTVIVRSTAGFIISPFPSNPWSGSDPALLVHARRRIDSLQLPDAPPLSLAETEALERQWVRDVVEGYAAVYAAADNAPIWISAIRFRDPSFVTTSWRTSTQGVLRPGDRVALGATVVQMSADSKSGCFEAIRSHIRSLQ